MQKSLRIASVGEKNKPLLWFILTYLFKKYRPLQTQEWFLKAILLQKQNCICPYQLTRVEAVASSLRYLSLHRKDLFTGTRNSLPQVGSLLMTVLGRLISII
jgi:hypothetical protein